MVLQKIVAAVVLTAALSGPVLAQTTVPAATGPALGVGDPAPALRIAQWYKGTPVPAFAAGHVYVVEFWATWCGPCKVSIPHLTALQKQYAGKVTFIGVDVLEAPAENTNESIVKLAAPFVAKMGARMDYTVAGDGTDRFMDQHWLKAAGQSGIPTAFVVMPDGKIGWIGHPNGLTELLPKVLAGTWDVSAERKQRDDLAAAAKPHNDARARIIPLYKAKDWAGVLAARNAVVAKSPELAKAPDIVSFGMEAMFNTDPKRAVAYVKELYGPDGLVTTNVVSSWDVFRVLATLPATGPMTAADWEGVATAVGPEVDRSTKKGYGHYTGYAEILWRAGEPGRAKVYQEKGVQILAAWNEAHKGTLVPGNIESLQQQQARLKAMTDGVPFAAAATTRPTASAG